MEDKPLIDSFVIVDCQNQLQKKSEAQTKLEAGIKSQIYLFGCTTKIEYVLVNSLKQIVSLVFESTKWEFSKFKLRQVNNSFEYST